MPAKYYELYLEFLAKCVMCGVFTLEYASYKYCQERGYDTVLWNELVTDTISLKVMQIKDTK